MGFCLRGNASVHGGKNGQQTKGAQQVVRNVVRDQVAIHHHLAQPRFKEKQYQAQSQSSNPLPVRSKTGNGPNESQQYRDAECRTEEPVDEFNPGVCGHKRGVVVLGVRGPLGAVEYGLRLGSAVRRPEGVLMKDHLPFCIRLKGVPKHLIHSGGRYGLAKTARPVWATHAGSGHPN